MVDAKTLRKLVGEVAKGTKGELATGDEEFTSDVSNYIPTGITVLDILLSGLDEDGKSVRPGGIPIGRVIEVFGNPDVGKSTLGLLMIRAFQRAGGVGVLIDTESTYYRNRGLWMGVDHSKLVYMQPDHMSEVVNTLLSLADKLSDHKDVPVVVVWDTIAATRLEKEARGENPSMAEKAREMKSVFRKMVKDLKKFNFTLVVLNHVIANLNPYGASTDTPGGSGPKFHSSIRLSVKRGGQFKDSDGVHGGLISTVTVIKHKLRHPGSAVNLVNVNLGGYDEDQTLFHVLSDTKGVWKLITGGHGGWYRVPDECLKAIGKNKLSFQARDFPSILETNPDLREWLVNHLWENARYV